MISGEENIVFYYDGYGFFLGSLVFAVEPDYKGVKGDFKVFCLGDSREVCEQKLKYLEAKTEITCPNNEGFSCIIAGVEYFGEMFFHENRLYQLTFYTYNDGFNNKFYDDQVKPLIDNSLKPIFLNNYGEPTYNYGCPRPSAINGGYNTFAYVWDLEHKRIEIGVMKSHYQYYPTVWITPKEIEAQKIEAEQMIQEEATQKF